MIRVVYRTLNPHKTLSEYGKCFVRIALATKVNLGKVNKVKWQLSQPAICVHRFKFTTIETPRSTGLTSANRLYKHKWWCFLCCLVVFIRRLCAGPSWLGDEKDNVALTVSVPLQSTSTHAVAFTKTSALTNVSFTTTFTTIRRVNCWATDDNYRAHLSAVRSRRAYANARYGPLLTAKTVLYLSLIHI